MVAVMMTRATMEVEVMAGDTMTAVMEGTAKAMVCLQQVCLNYKL